MITRDTIQGNDAVSQELLNVWGNISRAMYPIFLIIDRCMPSVSKDLVFDVLAIAVISSSILKGSTMIIFAAVHRCCQSTDFLFDMLKDPLVVTLFRDVGGRQRLFQTLYNFRSWCIEVHLTRFSLAQHLLFSC